MEAIIYIYFCISELLECIYIDNFIIKVKDTIIHHKMDYAINTVPDTHTHTHTHTLSLTG